MFPANEYYYSIKNILLVFPVNYFANKITQTSMIAILINCQMGGNI